MKICYYNHTGSVSGAENILFSVLRGAASMGHNAVVFAPENPDFRAVCVEQGIPFKPVSSLKARYTANPTKLAQYLVSTAGLVRQLGAHFRSEQPALVHANTTRGAIVATLAALRLNTPIVWHVHDMMPRHPISTAIRLLALLSGRNQIVAVSNATAISFQGKIPKSLQHRAPITVIHNGTDTARFAESSSGVSAFLAAHALSHQHFRIGMVGQITPRKGQIHVIHSLAAVVRAGFTHARLLIVGEPLFNNDGEYLAILQSEARRLGLEQHVLFLGKQDASLVMRALNVLVLNSSREPFGLVVTEAMASGTPVVAAAVDGVPEIVEDGESGLLFAPGDDAALTRHLINLALNPSLAAKLSRNGRQRVKLKFDEQAFHSKIRAFYKRVSASPALPTKPEFANAPPSNNHGPTAHQWPASATQPNPNYLEKNMTSSKCCICFTEDLRADRRFLLPTLVSAMHARIAASPLLADVIIFCFGADPETFDKFAGVCDAEGIKLIGVSPALIEHSPIAFARLFLHRFVPSEYSQLLFMDGDLQIRGDLDPLIRHMPPPGHFCAAADPMYFNPPALPGSRPSSKNVPAQDQSWQSVYFNAGVLRINRNGWADVSEQAFKYSTVTNPESCPFKDQDALNFVGRSRHIPISLKWNFPVFLRDCDLERHINPVVYHFMARPKPWQGNFPPWNSSFTVPYAKAIEKYPWLAANNPPAPLKFRLKYTLQQRYKRITASLDWGRGVRRDMILTYEASTPL